MAKNFGLLEYYCRTKMLIVQGGLYYRPQTKFAKVMFLHVSVILSTEGGYSSMPCRSPGPHPGGVSRPTTKGVSKPTPMGVCVSQNALRQTPPADGYCCGRYAFYWNAFLLKNITVPYVTTDSHSYNCYRYTIGF